MSLTESKKAVTAGIEAAQVVINALKATGGDPSPEKLRKALMKPIDTNAGRLEWTKDFSGIHPIRIVQIQEDLVSPKVIKSLVCKEDMVEKDGKKTLKYRVVQ